MKKYVIMLIMAFALLLPFQVNADLAPLRMESYAYEATVGSTVTYLIR